MTVLELLRAGAKTDSQDQVCTCTQPIDYVHIMYICYLQEGLTSLMLAIQNGHVDVVKALLDAKANPNISDKVCLQCGPLTQLLMYMCNTELSMDCIVLCR